MTGTLICWDGRRVVLPDLTSWRMEYACGIPCDSFYLECLWEPGEAGALAEAVRFAAEEDGERVFTGVVDEVCCGWDEDGARLSVSGRSMAALLLDNEALGCDYQTATLADILRDHVTPYGIQVGRTDRLPAVPDFSVAMGSSEWQALYHFCRYYGGVTPRFDRQGRLQVCAWQDGARRVLDEDAAVLELAWKEKRYGVLSEVLVRDKARDQVQRVVHSGFARRGGQCRRVLTMPGRSSYQAMRYSGEYQLQRAAEGWHSVELMLPGTFRAWPGELVEVNWKRDVCRGLWRVTESVCGMDAKGAYTRLTLADAAAVV